MKETSFLEVRKISKGFAASLKGTGSQKKPVLINLSLSVNKGEFVILLGPSGCGKSTLIHLIAGFEKTDEGQVLLAGTEITTPSSERGVVFQNAVLFPWLTVAENIAFGLKRSKVPKGKRAELVAEYLRLVQLEDYYGYDIKKLSGGMQQRVSLARTLVMHPKILLMDEPFSALDPVLRYEMQKLVLAIQKKLSQTILMVTHDIEEALLLADRIYILGPCPQGIVEEIVICKEDRNQEKLLMSKELLTYKNHIMETFLSLATEKE